MSEHSTQNPARVLAPLALLVCAVAFFAIVLGSGGGGDNEERPAAAKTEQRGKRTRGAAKEQRRARATYTVKTGDTLGEIAQETGVSVETLQELNPELDPQALVSGQKIKLRE